MSTFLFAAPVSETLALGFACLFGLGVFRSFQALLLFLTALRLTTAAISSAPCRNNFFSDSVSIRGAGEVPSLRLSKSIEGVSDAQALSHEFPSVRSVVRRKGTA